MRTSLIVILLVLGTGCASSRTPFDDPNRPTDVVEIEVANRNFNQATLWSVGLGERRRLGIVPGKGTETFIIPWTVSGMLQFEIQILSDARCLTEELDTDPGDLLYLEIPLETRSDPRCRRGAQVTPTSTTIRSATLVPAD